MRTRWAAVVCTCTEGGAEGDEHQRMQKRKRKQKTGTVPASSSCSCRWHSRALQATQTNTRACACCVRMTAVACACACCAPQYEAWSERMAAMVLCGRSQGRSQGPAGGLAVFLVSFGFFLAAVFLVTRLFFMFAGAAACAGGMCMAIARWAPSLGAATSSRQNTHPPKTFATVSGTAVYDLQVPRESLPTQDEIQGREERESSCSPGPNQGIACVDRGIPNGLAIGIAIGIATIGGICSSGRGALAKSRICT